MGEPASGTTAAAAAIVTSTGPMMALGAVMPAGASVWEFIWGCLFAILGACAYQFICAQAARQQAAEKGVAIADRPRIDTVMLGYSMCGAPMAAACLVFVIHKLGGGTGFGDLNFIQSAAGYMIAGAAGPILVFKVVGYFTAFVSSKTGAKP